MVNKGLQICVCTPLLDCYYFSRFMTWPSMTGLRFENTHVTLATDAFFLFVTCPQVVSNRLQGRVKVVKVDTEKYPKVASRYSIQVQFCVFVHSCFELTTFFLMKILKTITIPALLCTGNFCTCLQLSRHFCSEVSRGFSLNIFKSEDLNHSTLVFRRYPP